MEVSTFALGCRGAISSWCLWLFRTASGAVRSRSNRQWQRTYSRSSSPAAPSRQWVSIRHHPPLPRQQTVSLWSCRRRQQTFAKFTQTDTCRQSLYCYSMCTWWRRITTLPFIWRNVSMWEKMHDVHYFQDYNSDRIDENFWILFIFLFCTG